MPMKVVRLLLQSYEWKKVSLRRQNGLLEVVESIIYHYLWLYSHHTVSAAGDGATPMTAT